MCFRFGCVGQEHALQMTEKLVQLIISILNTANINSSQLQQHHQYLFVEIFFLCFQLLSKSTSWFSLLKTHQLLQILKWIEGLVIPYYPEFQCDCMALLVNSTNFKIDQNFISELEVRFIALWKLLVNSTCNWEHFVELVICLCNWMKFTFVNPTHVLSNQNSLLTELIKEMLQSQTSLEQSDPTLDHYLKELPSGASEEIQNLQQVLNSQSKTAIDATKLIRFGIHLSRDALQFLRYLQSKNGGVPIRFDLSILENELTNFMATLESFK